MHYVYTVIVHCEINMSSLQNVASSIFVLEDRCRKVFRNVSGTFTVILKLFWNTPRFFLGSRFLIKVCVRTIFDALRRRSPDSSLLAKKVVLNLACARRPILTLSSLPVYCNCTHIHELLSCDGFEVPVQESIAPQAFRITIVIVSKLGFWVSKSRNWNSANLQPLQIKKA